MAKSVIKKLDELMATELNLKLSEYTAMLHHAVTLVDVLEGFIFMYEKDNMFHYDVVDAWKEVNGMRLRIARFRSNPQIEDRLAKRQYKRWYIYGGGSLIPLNVTKVDDLKANFYFKLDGCPIRCNFTVLQEDSPQIRVKALVFHRKNSPGWGVKINQVLLKNIA